MNFDHEVAGAYIIIIIAILSYFSPPRASLEQWLSVNLKCIPQLAHVSTILVQLSRCSTRCYVLRVSS